MGTSDRAISILVATRNRAGSLRALLASLDRLSPPPVPSEVISADNGSADDTPAILKTWCSAAPGRRVVRVEQPGKARALNAAVRVATGQWLVFLDDDVVVAPDYLTEVWRFCERSDCAAAQGTILWPPAATADPSIVAKLRLFPDMVPQVNRPADWRPRNLVGANMVVRREMLMKVGGFDERLGPGAAGFGEDDDLTARILTAGGKLGYMAAAKVVHEIDPTRLHQAAYLERARKLGVGDYLRKHPPVGTWIVPRLAVTGLRVVATTVCGMRHARQRALGRWHRYCGMLETARQELNR